jgi:SAM-dependent methyltransferase
MEFKIFVREKIFKPFSLHYENYRKGLFQTYLNPTPNDKILDFGGNDGQRMARLFPNQKRNIFIADISSEALEYAKNYHGFETVLLDESGKIPFEDNFFDIVFCNSVIEHVTVDKDEIYSIKTNREFKEKSILRQKKLANEIRRVGKKYFVQTPNKYFIIENHTWLLSVYIYFPRSWQIKTIEFFGKFWIQNSLPDFNLLTIRDMKLLFPDAKIIKERLFLMTKSIIAVKN